MRIHARALILSQSSTPFLPRPRTANKVCPGLIQPSQRRPSSSSTLSGLNGTFPLFG